MNGTVPWATPTISARPATISAQQDSSAARGRRSAIAPRRANAEHAGDAVGEQHGRQAGAGQPGVRADDRRQVGEGEELAEGEQHRHRADEHHPAVAQRGRRTNARRSGSGAGASISGSTRAIATTTSSASHAHHADRRAPADDRAQRGDQRRADHERDRVAGERRRRGAAEPVARDETGGDLGHHRPEHPVRQRAEQPRAERDRVVGRERERQLGDHQQPDRDDQQRRRGTREASTVSGIAVSAAAPA